MSDLKRGEMQAATQLEIRRAGSDDAQAIADVLRASFLEFEALYTEGGFGATTPGPEQVALRLREGPAWVALFGNVMMGTVAATIKDGSVHIRGMAVLPVSRGSGVGTKLLQHVEGWAVEKGYRRLFLGTTPFLNSAIRLYEKFGFRRIDDLHDLFGTPLRTMEKVVSK